MGGRLYALVDLSVSPWIVLIFWLGAPVARREDGAESPGDAEAVVSSVTNRVSLWARRPMPDALMWSATWSRSRTCQVSAWVGVRGGGPAASA